MQLNARLRSGPGMVQVCQVNQEEERYFSLLPERLPGLFGYLEHLARRKIASRLSEPVSWVSRQSLEAFVRTTRWVRQASVSSSEWPVRKGPAIAGPL